MPIQKKEPEGSLNRKQQIYLPKIPISLMRSLTPLPSFFIENMETGRGDLKIGNLMVLTRFYGKKVKIELQD